MNKDIYYIVTEGEAPAVEEVPATGGKVAVVYERPTSSKRARRWNP